MTIPAFSRAGPTGQPDEEDLAAVRRALLEDPSRDFTRCDPITQRDYVDGVLRIARTFALKPAEVARRAIELSSQALPHDRARHVGYFLAGAGFARLATLCGGEPARRRIVGPGPRPDASRVYFTRLFLLTAGALGAALAFLGGVADGSRLIVLIAFSPIALRLSSFIAQASMSATRVARPLPRLQGTPEIIALNSTAIVLPVLIRGEDDLREAIRTLQDNAAIAHPQITAFVLLTDFRDSNEMIEARDEGLLRIIEREITRLNAHDHSPAVPRFVHIHRRRLYNPVERTWMGWERKRGKLLEFGRLVIGKPTPSFSGTEVPPALRNIRFAITLDSDSRLRPDADVELIRTIAHPLNAAASAGRILADGYAILAPRICPHASDLRSAFGWANYASRAEPAPGELTRSFYQDVFGDDMYGGKGIYDVRIFDQRLDAVLPENCVLSHDHLEGIFAKAGFCATSLIVEQFPDNFLSWKRRQHRWVRGDVQTLPWTGLGPRVRFSPPIRRPSAWIDRWKLCGNLLTHLQPVCSAALLGYAWLFLPLGAATRISFLVLAVPFLQVAIAVGGYLAAPFRYRLAPDLPCIERIPAETRLKVVKKIVRQGLLQGVLTTILLIDTALVSADAIGRALWRMYVSGRHRLEWNAAAPNDGTARAMSVTAMHRELKGSSLISVAMAGAVLAFNPQTLPIAAPVILIWLLAPAAACLSGRPFRTPWRRP